MKNDRPNVLVNRQVTLIRFTKQRTRKPHSKGCEHEIEFFLSTPIFDIYEFEVIKLVFLIILWLGQNVVSLRLSGPFSFQNGKQGLFHISTQNVDRS